MKYVMLLCVMLSSVCLAGESSVVLRKSTPVLRVAVSPEPNGLAGAPSVGKSKRLAFLFSVLMPGLGDLYLQNWQMRDWGSGKYFFATEVLLWSCHLYSVHRSEWLETDYRALAAQHAGVDWSSDKPSKYDTNIGKFSDIYYYNDVQRRASGTELLYEENGGNYWRWDNETNRRKYDRLRISSQKFGRISEYVVFGVVVNHLIAGVNTLREYRKMERLFGARMDFRLVPRPALHGKRGYAFQASLTRDF